ncbi:MAG: hypothetical protein E7324_09520 [Clostridiales bacterium]|nr:hypothetical protein [Clostridiales bacterium]
MQVSIREARLKDYERVLVVSDIHGYGHLLKKLLDQAAFCEKDALIILGDMIEKGPDNLGTLRYVMALSEQENVFPLMGNVDLWRLSLMRDDSPENQADVINFSKTAKQWWGSSIVGEMMEEMGLDLEKDGNKPGLFREIRCCFAKELDFIRNLPTVLETEAFHFVHGGLPHERLEELNGINPFSLLKNDNFLGQGLSFQKWVVAGHWPVALYRKDILQHGPVVDKERHILSVDGGCGVRGDGQLNLVITDWQGTQFSHLYAMDKPFILAEDAQTASETARNIPYDDPVVELVRKEEKWAVVRHHGYEMRIPLRSLQGDEKEWRCYNLTDYRLPVKPGDVFQMIFEYDGMAYCKKDNVCGWYKGRYQMIKETNV